MHTVKGQQRQKKKEQSLARFLDANNIKYERGVRIQHNCQGGTWSEIDFVIYSDWGAILLENDEDQHTLSNYTVSCDSGRMGRIGDSMLLAGLNHHAYWIRYNPDAQRIGGVTVRRSRAEKRAQLLHAIQTATPGTGSLSVLYLGYDKDTEDSKMPCICSDPEYAPDVKTCIIDPFIR